MSNPDIPSDIPVQFSLVPEVEDLVVSKEGQEVEPVGALSSPNDGDEQISSMPGGEDQELRNDDGIITNDLAEGEMSSALDLSGIPRNLSPSESAEPSLAIEDINAAKLSAPPIQSDMQSSIPSPEDDNAREVLEELPDEESYKTDAPLIPSTTLVNISPMKEDGTKGMTEDQDALEESAPDLHMEIQRISSSALIDEVNGVDKDINAARLSAPSIQSDIQSCMPSPEDDNAREVLEGSIVESTSLKKTTNTGDKMRKPFIGGYILHPSKIEYHNASANTTFLPQSHILQERKLERSTQTQWSDCPKILDTAITTATQTPVRGLHLIEPCHTYITPGKLTEIQPIDDEVIKIQRWWRNWLKRKRILIYLEEVKRQDEAWRKELDKVLEERQELKAKLNFLVDSLRTAEDFEHAYFAIELERKRLIQTAQSSYTGQLLNFAYVYILMQEINILQKIDQRKTLLSERKKIQQCHSLLNELSAPRTWISKRDGKPIAMETRIEREFAHWKNIYHNLTNTGLSSDQRREVLNEAYKMLEMHDDEDVHHIKDMITQELVLLVIGVDMEKLKSFHGILEHHLFDHLESYALKNRSKLQEYKLSRLKCRLHVCTECAKVKHESSFDANTRTKELVKCKSCVQLQNMSCKRKDYAIFRHILASLRKEETRLRCSSPVAFIIQVEDIYYLINSIWHAHSALSHKRALEDLRLGRFDNSVDWSPWNCILLTHEEMVAHRLVTNPFKVYGECLIKMVQSKHQIAREYFKFLRDVSDRHYQTIEWHNVKKSKPYKYYAVNAPRISYVNQPEKIKLNPSKYERPAGKCKAEIQRL